MPEVHCIRYPNDPALVEYEMSRGVIAVGSYPPIFTVSFAPA